MGDSGRWGGYAKAVLRGIKAPDPRLAVYGRKPGGGSYTEPVGLLLDGAGADVGFRLAMRVGAP